MLYPPSGLPDFTQDPARQFIAGSRPADTTHRRFSLPALSFFRHFLYNFAVDVMRNGRKRQCGGNDELRRSAYSHDES